MNLMYEVANLDDTLQSHEYYWLQDRNLTAVQFNLYALSKGGRGGEIF